MFVNYTTNSSIDNTILLSQQSTVARVGTFLAACCTAHLMTGACKVIDLQSYHASRLIEGTAVGWRLVQGGRSVLSVHLL